MDRKLILAWLFFAGIILSSGPSYGASFYPERLDDPCGRLSDAGELPRAWRRSRG